MATVQERLVSKNKFSEEFLLQIICIQYQYLLNIVTSFGSSATRIQDCVVFKNNSLILNFASAASDRERLFLVYPSQGNLLVEKKVEIRRKYFSRKYF